MYHSENEENSGVAERWNRTMRQKMVKYVQLILLKPIHVYACYIHAHASYITEQQRISIVDKNDSCGKEAEET